MSNENSPEIPGAVVIRDERGRFKPGGCANPGGRSRADLEISELLARLTPRALEILGEKMETVDVVAARAITTLGVAPPKSRHVRVEIGPLHTAGECLAALSRVAEAVSSAEITPTDAEPLVKMITAAQKILEGSEVEARLAAIEAAVSIRREE